MLALCELFLLPLFEIFLRFLFFTVTRPSLRASRNVSSRLILEMFGRVHWVPGDGSQVVKDKETRVLALVRDVHSRRNGRNKPE